jgi:hypothetical protein
VNEQGQAPASCQLLNVKQLAATLNVHERTCWRLEQNQGTGIPLGRLRAASRTSADARPTPRRTQRPWGTVPSTT